MMNRTFFILLIFLASTLLAQQPTITYLICDEAKSRLQIFGSFGSDSGSVTIEDTTLGIVSWSDSLIVCNLPDSGKGSGGTVVVQSKDRKSYKRVLSIIFFDIESTQYEIQYYTFWRIKAEYFWYCRCRADLLNHGTNNESFSFEISKCCRGVNYPRALPWTDTNDVKDSAIAVAGTIDIPFHKIYMRKIIMGTGGYLIDGSKRPFYLPPKLLNYDIGSFFGSSLDTNYEFGQERPFIYNFRNGHILFSPAVDIAVPNCQSSGIIKFLINKHLLNIASENTLGPTTASLFSIDGRLLKREQMNISAPGEYSFDVSGIHSQMGFLVLQTEKGVIARKIVLP